MPSPPGASAGPPVITVVLADPHASPRAALAAALSHEPDIAIVASIGAFDEARAAVRLRRPHVALVDVAALGHRGMSGIAELRAAARLTAVLVIGVVDDPALGREAIRQGAAGRVLKDASRTEIVSAVHDAAARRTRLRLIRGGD